MIYLVEPSRRGQWCNVHSKVVLTAARERAADLSKLDWAPSEAAATDAHVRVALRHGTPVPGGLVVDAGLLGEQDQADLIRQAHRRAAASREQLAPVEAKLERVMPGNTERGRELDRRVDESTARAVERAEEEAAEALRSAADDRLVAHWRALGGVVPDPV